MFWMDVLFEILVFLIQGLLQIPLTELQNRLLGAS